MQVTEELLKLAERDAGHAQNAGELKKKDDEIHALRRDLDEQAQKGQEELESLKKQLDEQVEVRKEDRLKSEQASKDDHMEIEELRYGAVSRHFSYCLLCL